MVVCFYGGIVILKTSWTSTNPGCRFHSSPQINSRCDFSGWIDPPMCARQDKAIHTLKVKWQKLQFGLVCLVQNQFLPQPIAAPPPLPAPPQPLATPSPPLEAPAPPPTIPLEAPP
ncbi:hypothetical protein LXL04_004495 [Taraxacum kok-saghyz]